MTSEEERKLRTYLHRIGATTTEADWEEWCSQRHESEEGEAEYKATLGLAHAYALGYAEGW